MATDKFEFRVFSGPFAGMRVNLEISAGKIVAVELTKKGEAPTRHAVDGNTVPVMNTTFTIGMLVEEVESNDIEVTHTLAAIQAAPENSHHDLLTGA